MALLDDLLALFFKQAKKSAKKHTKAAIYGSPAGRQASPASGPQPRYLRTAPKHSFVVVDLETTGLRADTNSILEIGALMVDRNGEVVDEWQSILITPNRLSRKIIGLTGITQEMVDQDGVDPKKALEDLSYFARGRPMVAYNAPFDAQFLYAANAKQGLEFEIPFYCALKASRKAFPGLPGYKLGQVAAHCGIDTSGAHRALADCRMTHQVYMRALAAM